MRFESSFQAWHHRLAVPAFAFSLCGVVVGAVIGCAEGPKPPAVPQQIDDPPGLDARRADDVDQGGALPVSPDRSGFPVTEPEDRYPADDTLEPRPGEVLVDPETGEAIDRGSSSIGDDAPAETSAAEPPSIRNGYQTVGGVFAEVNGRAIYTQDALNILEPALRAAAKRMDLRQFRSYALQEIIRQQREMIRAELEVAAAERYLDPADKNRAHLQTIAWRAAQISNAGGSEALARQRVREETGMSFDEAARQEYRKALAVTFYRKHVLPRIQVSAEDMRAYYRDHIDQFREKGEVTFLVIETNANASGSKENARAKAEQLRQRILAGEDFAEVARQGSDDPFLRESGGDLGIGALQKGAYRWKPVDDAVWTTPIGEVTPVIEADNGNRFFIAKVLDRKEEKVHSFDDPAVQEQVRNALSGPQYEVLREKVYRDPVLSDEKQLTEMALLALEVVNQNYERWRSGETGFGATAAVEATSEPQSGS